MGKVWAKEPGPKAQTRLPIHPPAAANAASPSQLLLPSEVEADPGCCPSRRLLSGGLDKCVKSRQVQGAGRGRRAGLLQLRRPGRREHGPLHPGEYMRPAGRDGRLTKQKWFDSPADYAAPPPALVQCYTGAARGRYGRRSRVPRPKHVSQFPPAAANAAPHLNSSRFTVSSGRGHPPSDCDGGRSDGAGGGVDGLPETPPAAPARRRGGARAAGAWRGSPPGGTCAAGRRTARRSTPAAPGAGACALLRFPLRPPPPGGGGGGVVRAREPAPSPRGSGRTDVPVPPGRAAGG